MQVKRGKGDLQAVGALDCFCQFMFTVKNQLQLLFCYEYFYYFYYNRYFEFYYYFYHFLYYYDY